MAEDLTNEPDDHPGWEVRAVSPETLWVDLVDAGIVTSPTQGLPWWIVYDPRVEPQYSRKEQSSHDGTLLFSYQLDGELFRKLIDGTSFYVPEPQPSPKHIPVYTVGDVTRRIHVQTITVPAGQIHGQVERVSMPVRVTWKEQATSTPATTS